MAFSFETWLEQFKKRMRNWKERMQHAAVTSTYFFISAGALWPVVEALRQGDEKALAVLGSALVVGTTGSLLANQLKDWKDEADAGARGCSLGTKGGVGEVQKGDGRWETPIQNFWQPRCKRRRYS